MKKAIITLILTFSALAMPAQNLERIFTNDGKIYYGYISSQVPGKEIVVKTVASVIVSDKASISSPTTVSFSKLSGGWKEFLRDNPDILADTSRIIISDVRMDDSASYRDAIVLQSGDVVKFVSLTENSRTIEWANYNKVVRMAKPKNEFSWVVSTFETKDGRIINGQMIEQINGKYMSVLDDKNELKSIMLNNIRCIKFRGLDERSSIFNQSRTLDIVNLKNDSVKGIITENCPGEYVLVAKENGSIMKIKSSDIVSYGKTLNADYKNVTDFEVKEGEFYCKGDTLSIAKFEIDDTSMILDGKVSLEVKSGEKVTIITRYPEDALLYLVKAKTIEEKVKKSLFDWKKSDKKDKNVNNDKKDKSDSAVYYKTLVQFRDLFSTSIPCDKVRTPLGNTKVEFTAKSSGIYVMFVQGNDSGIVINVN